MPHGPVPAPPLAAHNWRKRAEQMRVIAESVENATAKKSLLRQAEEFLAKAEEAEKGSPCR
jgi:hypothetical protein